MPRFVNSWEESVPGWHRRLRAEIVKQTEESHIPSQKATRLAASGDYRIGVWRLPYGKMDDECGPFRNRDVEMNVWNAEGVIASAVFVEWRSDDPSCGTIDDFVYWADSFETREFGEAISEQWGWAPPFECGTVVIFDRLKIVSRRDVDRKAWPMLREMIDREFKRRSTILFLKAFPLEFEGKAGSIDYDRLFHRRQTAMVAHYGRQLEVEPIPGESGKKGWMWKPLGRYCSPPASEVFGEDDYDSTEL